jgi:hypothetical protein
LKRICKLAHNPAPGNSINAYLHNKRRYVDKKYGRKHQSGLQNCQENKVRYPPHKERNEVDDEGNVENYRPKSSLMACIML